MHLVTILTVNGDYKPDSDNPLRVERYQWIKIYSPKESYVYLKKLSSTLPLARTAQVGIWAAREIGKGKVTAK
jgi:hypothetical protein